MQTTPDPAFDADIEFIRAKLHSLPPERQAEIRAEWARDEERAARRKQVESQHANAVATARASAEADLAAGRRQLERIAKEAAARQQRLDESLAQLEAARAAALAAIEAN